MEERERIVLLPKHREKLKADTRLVNVFAVTPDEEEYACWGRRSGGEPHVGSWPVGTEYFVRRYDKNGAYEVVGLFEYLNDAAKTAGS